MNKSIAKTILKNNIRIYLSDYKNVIESILNNHDYLPFPNVILANALTAVISLKFLYGTSKMSAKYKTNGPIKSLIIEVNNESVRALIENPNIETEFDKKNFNSIPLILGIGDSGIFQVSRIFNNETFVSEVPIARADVVSDVAYYLNHSDQIFSAVLNNVILDESDSKKVIVANNVIFQLLPEHTEEDIVWIEKFIKENNFIEYKNIDEYEEKIDGKLIATNEINAICWCDKQKIINAINLLSISEKEEMFLNTESIETKCDFCNKVFNINKKEL